MKYFYNKETKKFSVVDGQKEFAWDLKCDFLKAAPIEILDKYATTEDKNGILGIHGKCGDNSYCNLSWSPFGGWTFNLHNGDGYKFSLEFDGNNDRSATCKAIQHARSEVLKDARKKGAKL